MPRSVVTLCKLSQIVYVCFYRCFIDVKAQWPDGKCARVQIEWSRFRPWLRRLSCVLGQDFTLTVPLSTQVFKCMGTNEVSKPGKDQHPIQMGVGILLVAPQIRTEDLEQAAVVQVTWLVADVTFTYMLFTALVSSVNIKTFNKT